MSVFPSPGKDDFTASTVAPFNAVASFGNLGEFATSTVMFDNKAIGNICRNKLNIEEPSFGNLNKLIA